MIEQKTFPLSWIYKNVYNLTEDDMKEFDAEIEENMKRSYKMNQLLENGGEQPAEDEDGGGDDWGGGSDDEGSDWEEETVEEEPIETEEELESDESLNNDLEVGGLEDAGNVSIPDDYSIKGNQKLTKETRDNLRNSIDTKFNKKFTKEII